MRRWRIWLIIAVLLIIGLSVRQVTKPQPKGIETVRAEITTLVKSVTASGKITADKQVDLHFQTGGRLSWVGVHEGDQVTAWQVLASLDTQEMQKNLEKALRDYAKERNDFEENKQITYKDQVMSDTIKRILEQNQWDLEKAVLDVELKEIALKWASLVSPILGIVTHVSTPVAGVNVTTTDTITVVDPKSLVFRANVDETDIGNLLLDQKAYVSLDAYPDKEFTGKVVKIGLSAEISGGGATVFPVDVKLDQIDKLLLGLNGDVRIVSSEKTNTLTVPVAAVREAKEFKYAIRKTAGEYERVEVTVGTTSDEAIEILSGISAGDEVVTEGFQFLPKGIIE